MVRTKRKKDEIAIKWQENLHLYLQSTIDAKEWSVSELAQTLEIANSTAARLKNRYIPTSPVLGLLEIKRLGELKGIEADEMVSIIIGKTNEEGNSTSVFSQRILSMINSLPNVSQVHLAEILDNLKGDEGLIAEISKILKCGDSHRNLLKILSSLNDKQTKALLSVASVLEDKE